MASFEEKRKNEKQGNQGSMLKSTWHDSFSKLAAFTVIWSKKQKNPFLDKVNGSMCANFHVCIVFRLARRRDTNTYTHIQVKLGISSTRCLPHVDFEKIKKAF